MLSDFTNTGLDFSALMIPEFDTSKYCERRRAVDFSYKYIPHFCVYCETTGQIYTEYYLDETADCSRVIVMPKADHNTFKRVVEHSIIPTSLMLVPNNRLSRAVVCDRRKPGATQPANQFLLDKVVRNGLVPVVKKSDLRRMRTDLPYLTMHHVALNKLTEQSEFAKKGFLGAVVEKIEAALSTFGAG